MQPKTTAKDFFVYLAGFITLYVSTISLISLLFEIINKAFPDAVNYGYYYSGDLYTSGMRMAIASLLIVFPIYLLIASYLNKYLRQNPDKKDLSVRKWLTYLTLFITGVAVVVDLIVLVNTFLGGEITTRFVLKVLAVIVVASAVFAYYLYDLRKSFDANMPQRTTLIVTLASVFVFGTLIGGLIYIGSPMKARNLKFDNMRTEDLSSIQWQIINYWQQKGVVPQTLNDVEDPISGYYSSTDPVTGDEYVYQKTGPLSFKLCATFALPSEDRDDSMPVRSYGTMPAKNDTWEHGAGQVCFDRTIDPELYPVRSGNTVLKVPQY